MKFLLDQDVYVRTLGLLMELGHDIIPVAQIGLAQACDEELLKRAQQENGNKPKRGKWTILILKKNPVILFKVGLWMALISPFQKHYSQVLERNVNRA